mmetsp:Transcript_5377/g.12986  ORF Transcript_5377/g.12986 Transcript_5377/m.12986 type:complete len:200 (+) Transcript_5377:1488-2087(+)
MSKLSKSSSSVRLRGVLTSSSDSSLSPISSSSHLDRVSKKPSPPADPPRGVLVCRRPAAKLPWASAAIPSPALAAWNGGCRSQRLCRGRPSVPAKSSNSVKWLGSKSRAQSCKTASKTERHSASRKRWALCATHCNAARSAICVRVVRTPDAAAFVKYVHIVLAKLFTASTCSKYALMRAKSWKPIIASDTTEASETDS